jgi:hypothetical protein
MARVVQNTLVMRPLLVVSLFVAACGQSPSEAPSDAGPGTDGPSSGFTTPVSPNALVFELKGMVNPYDHVLSSEHATFGKGEFRFHEDGKKRAVIREDPMVYEYVYSKGKESGAKAGQRVLVFRALEFHHKDSSAARYRVTLAQVIVPEEALEKSSGSQQIEDVGAAQLRATLRDITSVVRADDVVLYKDCTRGMLDTKNAASRLRIDQAAGQSGLKLGQPLFVWGNLALEVDPARLATLVKGKGLELHQGQYCGCMRDEKQITCAEFETEAKKSGEELSCPLPQGFLKPPTGTTSHLALTFKGPINATGGEDSPTTGLATLSLSVGGKPYALDYQSHASRYPFESGAWAGQEIVEILSMGDVRTVAEDRYAFNVLLTRVRADLLQKMKADNVHQPPSDTQLGYVAFLFEAEQIYPQVGDNLVRMCPVAVTATPPGNLHLCHAGNKSFAAGETLELAASLTLSGDPKEVAAWLGSGCFCTKNGATMSCDEFPEKKKEK